MPTKSTTRSRSCLARTTKFASISDRREAIAKQFSAPSFPSPPPVAGAAREHWEVLIIGLTVSVALMGLAATLIAKLLHKYPWISYAGVFIVLFVAIRMIWDGFEKLYAAGGIGPVLRSMGIS